MRVNFINYQAQYASKQHAKNRQNASFGTNVEAVHEFLTPALNRTLNVIMSSSYRHNSEVLAAQARAELIKMDLNGRDTIVQTQVVNDAKGEWLVLSEGRQDDPKSFRQIGKVYTASSDGYPTQFISMTEEILKVLQQ